MVVTSGSGHSRPSPRQTFSTGEKSDNNCHSTSLTRCPHVTDTGTAYGPGGHGTNSAQRAAAAPRQCQQHRSQPRRARRIRRTVRCRRNGLQPRRAQHETAHSGLPPRHCHRIVRYRSQHRRAQRKQRIARCRRIAATRAAHSPGGRSTDGA